MTASVRTAGFAGWATRLFAKKQARLLEDESDGVLLARAGRGEEAACRELLRRHGPRLFSVVEATHRDASLAEDVVQETFLRAIDRAGQLRDEARLFPWLVRIALRVAIDHRRKTRRESPLDETWDTPSRPEDGPDRRAEASQDARLVEKALSELPEYQRELVALRYFAHMSAAELSEVFGKSEVAIRKDLQRARGLLKDILLPWMEGAE